MHTCMPTYIHTYIHTCIHAYMHTCIHAYYLFTCLLALSHTIFHIPLCHTHNCFNFSILHRLLSLSFPVPATTFDAHYWKKLTCGVIRPFNFWSFCPFSLQVASAPARCSPEGCSHVRVLFQSQDAAVCYRLRYSSFREIDMVNWQNIYVRCEKWACSGVQQKLTGVNAAATHDAKIIRNPFSCGLSWTPCRLSLPPHHTEVEVHVSTCAQVSKSKSSPAGQVLLKRPWTSVAWTIDGSRCPVHSGTRRCRYSKREKRLWMSGVLCRTRLASTHPYPRLHCAIKIDHAYMSMYIYKVRSSAYL